jgi:alpha-galactosidase
MLKQLIAVFLFAQCNALDNGLGMTPAMGWNSWNHYKCNISETLIHAQADAFKTFLAPAGYEYLNLDE